MPKPVNIPGLKQATKQLMATTPMAPRAPRSSATVRATGMSTDASQALGAAVAEALFGQKPKPRMRFPGHEESKDQGETMEPVLGSVLQFTAVSPGWLAVLSDGENEWQEPIIGWAVVVIWTAYQDDNEEESTKGTKQFQTEVQPLTLTRDGQMETPVFRDNVELVTIAIPGMVRL